MFFLFQIIKKKTKVFNFSQKIQKKIKNWKKNTQKIHKFYRKTGRALLRNQCCCDYGENYDYENSVGKI